MDPIEVLTNVNVNENPAAGFRTAAATATATELISGGIVTSSRTGSGSIDPSDGRPSSPSAALSQGRQMARLVRRQRPRPTHRVSSRAKFTLHEMWDGVVEDVCATYFGAQLVSRTVPNTFEYAEILLAEVSPADRPLLQEGALFYWAIGYEDSASGQRTRTSLIKFRRLGSLPADAHTGWMERVARTWLNPS